MSDFREYVDEIAAVLHPLPAEAEEDGLPGFVHTAMTAHQQQLRRETAERLERVVNDVANHNLDHDHDEALEDNPLLVAIGESAKQRDDADAAVQRLIAYAREYAPGKRPSLRRLAAFAGRSESWASAAVTAEVRSAVAAEVLPVRGSGGSRRDPETAAIDQLTRHLGVAEAGDVEVALSNPDTRLRPLLAQPLDDDTWTRVTAYLHTRYTTGTEN